MALQGAARASDGCGDHKALAGYRRLLAALREPEPPEPALPEPEPPSAPSLSTPSSPTPRVRLRIVKGEEETAFEELAAASPSEVLGQDGAMTRLRNIVLDMPPSASSASSKRQLRGGALLWGPPGCGKTFVARALAGELGMRCLRVPLTDLGHAYPWDSERKLQGTLSALRGRSPAILLFDDLDALTPHRHETGSARVRRLVNRFLLGLCDLLNQEARLYVLAATTRPWDVEPALRRAGRFDKPVFVPPPNADARAAILREQTLAPSAIDFARLARQTEHMSIPDLQKIWREAADAASPRAPDTVDLLRALPKVRASTREWLEGARNFALFAEPYMHYDDLRQYLQAHAL